MMECMFDFIPVFSSEQLLLISKALINILILKRVLIL